MYTEDDVKKELNAFRQPQTQRTIYTAADVKAALKAYGKIEVERQNTERVARYDARVAAQETQRRARELQQQMPTIPQYQKKEPTRAIEPEARLAGETRKEFSWQSPTGSEDRASPIATRRPIGQGRNVARKSAWDILSEPIPEQYQEQSYLDVARGIVPMELPETDSPYSYEKLRERAEKSQTGLRAMGKRIWNSPGFLYDLTQQHIKDASANIYNQEYQEAKSQPRPARDRYYQYIAQNYGGMEPDERIIAAGSQLDILRQRMLQETDAFNSLKTSTPLTPETSEAMRKMREASQMQQEALQGLPPWEQKLEGMAYSIMENAAYLPTAAINPAVPLALMGGSAAAQKGYELSEQGVGASEALGRGIVSGAIEAVTEKLPLDNLMDIIKVGGGTSMVKTLLKQMGVEASEETASYVLNYVADKASNDPNAMFSFSEMAEQALGGAISGGVFGVGSMALSSVINRPSGRPASVSEQAAQYLDQSQMTAVPSVEEMNATSAPAYSTTVNTEQMKKAARGESAALVNKLRRSIETMNDMKPVSYITGNEFQKSDTGLREQVGTFFKSIGNRVFRKGFGEVILDDKGIRSSASHGIGSRKAATFQSVPWVIAEGVQIDHQPNWKGRGYDSYIFAAPVQVGEGANAETNYVAAVVTHLKDNRYYLHEAVDQDGNLIFGNKKEPGVTVQTGSVATEGSTGGTPDSLAFIVPNQGENVNDNLWDYADMDADIIPQDAQGFSDAMMQKYGAESMDDALARMSSEEFDKFTALFNQSVEEAQAANLSSARGDFEAFSGEMYQKYGADSELELFSSMNPGEAEFFTLLYDEMRQEHLDQFTQEADAAESQRKALTAASEQSNLSAWGDFSVYAEEMSRKYGTADMGELSRRMQPDEKSVYWALFERMERAQAKSHSINEGTPDVFQTREEAKEASHHSIFPATKEDPTMIKEVIEMNADPGANIVRGAEPAGWMTMLQDKGVSANKDIFRNLDAAAGRFPDVREGLRQAIEVPLLNAKAAYTDAVAAQLDGFYEQMQQLGIQQGGRESAAVQWIGEGQRQDGSKLIPYTEADLMRDFPDMYKNINAAEGITRALYDQYVDCINLSLESIYPNVKMHAEIELHKLLLQGRDAQLANQTGYANELFAKAQKLEEDIKSGEILRSKRLIPRKDYFHHFTEMQQGFEALKNILASPSDIDSTLAGISEFTKPKSKFAGFLQQRKGGKYVEDAVGGMVRYIPMAEYKIHIDPFIAYMRGTINSIAKATKDTRNANHFIKTLTNWTNDIAGKTNPFDRPVQDWGAGGRRTMKILNWFNSRAKANAVVGNLASAIVQIGNIPNATTYIKKPKYWAQAAQDYTKGRFGSLEGTAAEQSKFLKERYQDHHVEQFDAKTARSLGRFAKWTLEIGDHEAAKVIWLAAYRQYQAEGAGPRAMRRYESAVDYADDITRRSVAGRGIGELPLTQRSKLLQMLAPFQVEVNNTFQLLTERIKEKDAAALLAYSLSTWMVNALIELITGRRPLLDPIDALLDALGDDDEEEQKSGVEKGIDIASRLAGEVVSNMPYASTAASLLVGSEQSQKLFGDNDPTRFGTGIIGLQTLAKPVGQLVNGEPVDLLAPLAAFALPYGGKQLERSIRSAQDLGILPYLKLEKDQPISLQTNAFPASRSANGRVRFPIETPWSTMGEKDLLEPLRRRKEAEQKDLLAPLRQGTRDLLAPLNRSVGPYVNTAKALAFGPWSTTEGRDYINFGYSPLSEKQSASMEQLAEEGVKPHYYYAALLAQKGIKGDKNAEGNTIPLSASEKRKQAIDAVLPDASKEMKERIYRAMEISEKVW